MKINSNFLSTAAPKWSIIFVWLYLVFSFSLATPVPACPDKCVCSRNRDGLQKASCINIQWDKTVYPNIHLLELKPLDIDFKCNIHEDISLLFPQLNFISLKNCSLTHVPSNSFRNLKLLQEVDLSHNSISKFSHSLFIANEKLRYVNVENNPLSIGAHPLLTSSSILELNVASCNLSQLSPSTFKDLPNLRFLSLANNKLEIIRENTLPSGLRKLDLSQNMIVNVPLLELDRLKKLKEIDISRNPINCTCQLMDFQDRSSSKAIIFRNNIRCLFPTKYVGYLLPTLPRYQLCEVKEQSNEQLVSNLLQLNNGYVVDEQFNKAENDDFLFEVNIDQVVSTDEKRHRSRRFSNQHTNVSKNKEEITIEGSGNEEVGIDSSGDGNLDSVDENKNEKNKSLIIDTVSKILVDSNKLESWETSSFKVEYKDMSSQSTATAEDGSSQMTVFYDDITSSSPIFLDTVTATSKKGPEMIESGGGDFYKETTTFASVFSSNLVGVGLLVSTKGRVDNTTQSIPTASTTDTSVDMANSPIAKEYHDSNVPTNELKDLPVTLEAQIEKKVMTEQTEVSQINTTQVMLSNNSLVDGSSILQRTSDEHNVSARPIIINGESKETITNELGGKKEDGSTQSTAQPFQGQMTKNNNVKNGTSTQFTITLSLVIVVVVICLAVFFSRHNYRTKNWNQNDSKVNNSNELQDISLLKADIQRQNSDLCSEKYETEGKNTQTEKLISEHGGGDNDHLEENNCASPTSELLIKDNNTRVQKSTVRVTTIYESLPKTPTIIHKS